MGDLVWPENIVFWGAGATKAVGLLTSDDIAHALTHIIESYIKDKYIKNIEYSEVFGEDLYINSNLKKGFKKFLNCIDPHSSEHIDEFKYYNLEILAEIFPNIAREFNIETGEYGDIKLEEFFTLLDQLIEKKLGLKVSEKRFLQKEEIIIAKNTLSILIEEIQRVAIQGAHQGRMNDDIKDYSDLADCLSKLMLEEAMEFDRRDYDKEQRKFYIYSYAIISFNWDPVILWEIFNSHKKFNNKCYCTKDGKPLKLFDDLGTIIATRRLDGKGDNIWYSSNETQAMRINDPDYATRIMRVGKILYPHGIFGGRLCPQCGKFIMSLGSQWDQYSSEPFGPSIVYDLQKNWKYIKDDNGKYLEKDGQIKCLFCGHITRPKDVELEIQSLIKNKSIPPIEEVKKEMALLVRNAKHIVLAGYTFPLDDILEKTFILSALSGGNRMDKKVTILNYDKNKNNREKYPMWLEGNILLQYLRENKNTKLVKTIKNLCTLFNFNNIRLNIQGIPAVLKKEDQVFLDRVIDVVYRNEFPVQR